MDVYEYGNKASNIILIQMVDENSIQSAEKEFDLINLTSENTKEDFCLRAFKVKNWNEDLSPWKAPAVFGKQDFGDKAESTLAEVLKACSDKTKKYYIGGYSLAGLFALWCSYQTPIFSGVAAASPSIWFPGFLEYMKENEIKTGSVYLSLGDKEAKTRNPVMATVAERIQDARDYLMGQNINCHFEWNKGNHFSEPDLRTAKAFSWVLSSR